MAGLHFTGLVPTVLLLANAFLPVTTAQTATLDIPTGLPASCTPLATLLSDYPPPKDGQILDKALNNGLDVAFSQTTTEWDDLTAFCGFIISTQIPSATPSVTSAMSSYISAAGIWLEEHGLEQAESLLDGDCDAVVQLGDYDAQADLDFVVGFGQCYEALGWGKRASGAGATTTTHASSIPTVSATVTSTSVSATTASQSDSANATASPTGQTGDKGAPPNAGSRRMVDASWLLGATVCVMLLLS
ncbi:hypothetical protein F5Y07DRAFT_218173 [Xylaria sp. FL0933]|nr:hypothetical protein F5Y07DRAFT_218173 [Xylaria sp. FL0933]